LWSSPGARRKNRAERNRPRQLLCDEPLGVSCGHVEHEAPPHAETTRDFASDEIVLRKIRVRAIDVVLVKGICEASEGLCGMFA
jgi:hypothetical protein